ncbi:MAG: HopJ type III effector protein [Colwellia sp.]|nr:HopJ type III effector protein [Colwellia sp.]MCW8863473.1 HopJ type III effector protein [Colwellia sp.]MCW9079907.1 HopJ type III effector protein [Colwellia sp.]
MINNQAYSLTELLSKIKQNEQSVEFEQVMQVIAENYHYQPAAFTNGELFNDAGTNEGSCKIFSFAQLNDLNQQQTLACFGRYYREDVLANPAGNDHGNIRNFMKTGWQGVAFKTVALQVVK